MNNKKKEPEFDIIDDTPITSDGECPCLVLGKRDISCHIHGG
jgi:hypothetical protein